VRLYRTMREAADGLPVVGPSPRTLGVRPGSFPNPDVPAVQPDDLVQPGDGGLSVAPDDPMYLPYFRRPPSLGGKGSDPVWYIELDELGLDLSFRQHKTTHGLIEPSRPMTLREFQDALARTRNRWQLACRP
jgi:hypothetical protein